MVFCLCAFVRFKHFSRLFDLIWIRVSVAFLSLQARSLDFTFPPFPSAYILYGGWNTEQRMNFGDTLWGHEARNERAWPQIGLKKIDIFKKSDPMQLSGLLWRKKAWINVVKLREAQNEFEIRTDNYRCGMLGNKTSRTEQSIHSSFYYHSTTCNSKLQS